MMSFGRTCEVYNYTMKKAAISLPMNRCDQECDLGVLFTPDLKFSHHAHKINYTQSQQCNWHYQTFIQFLRPEYVSHPLYQSGSPPLRIRL